MVQCLYFMDIMICHLCGLIFINICVYCYIRKAINKNFNIDISGQLIDREALTTLLNDHETWLWDNGETASLQDIQQKVKYVSSAFYSNCCGGLDYSLDIL
jgi:hypothetical protein